MYLYIIVSSSAAAAVMPMMVWMLVIMVVIQIGLADYLLPVRVCARVVHRIRGRNVFARRVRHGDLDLLVQSIAGGHRHRLATVAAAQARRKLCVSLRRRTADAGGGAMRTSVALVLMVMVQMMVRMGAQLVARAAAAMDAQCEAFLLESVAGAFNACRRSGCGFSVKMDGRVGILTVIG